MIVAEPAAKEILPAGSIPVKMESSPAAPTLSSEIERLRINWKQMLDDVPRGSYAVALLRTVGPPASIENDTIILSAKSDIHKKNIEKPEMKSRIEKIFCDYLGHPCQVQCILDPKKDHLVNYAKKMGAQITSVEENE